MIDRVLTSFAGSWRSRTTGFRTWLEALPGGIAVVATAGTFLAAILVPGMALCADPSEGRQVTSNDPYVFCETFLASAFYDLFRDGKQGQMWAYPITFTGPTASPKGYVTVPSDMASSMKGKVVVTRKATLSSESGLPTLKKFFDERGEDISVPFWLGAVTLVIQSPGFNFAFMMGEKGLEEASQDGAESAREVGVLLAPGGTVLQTAVLEGDPPDRWLVQSTLYQVKVGEETRTFGLCSMRAWAP